ncbi:MAG: hypothetical protein QT00_C0002G0149 [archaeon GW2011_AR5]|nr:MAG: hypothetical protein QT00_C0002G0149 [archaeon GW2011_AR5]
MPHRSSVPMTWRLKHSRYTLSGTACACGKLHMPPRVICDCGNDKLETKVFSGNGEIVSFTEIHIGPAGFDRNTPYNVALIKLEEGPVVSGIVIGVPEIGKKVKGIFRRLHTDGEEGLISYGFKFEVV